MRIITFAIRCVNVNAKCMTITYTMLNADEVVCKSFVRNSGSVGYINSYNISYRCVARNSPTTSVGLTRKHKLYIRLE